MQAVWALSPFTKSRALSSLLFREWLQPCLWVDEVEDRLMPQQAILWLEHPMVFIWKSQELTLNATSLQRVERGQAFTDE